jgi:probable HAF family extracellular repeat protein
MRRFIVTFALSWLMLGWCGHAAQAQPRYGVTRIDGRLPGHFSSRFNDLNRYGQMAGKSEPSPQGGGVAVLYSDGQVIRLGGGEAYSINGSGEVAGFTSVINNSSGCSLCPFLYSRGTLSILGAFGGRVGVAYGINDSGQVVGYADTADGRSHAFLYDAGVMSDLGVLPGTNNSVARSINSSGQIAGWSFTVNSSILALRRAFIYSGGRMTDPGGFGGDDTTATSINDIGQVVGSSEKSDGTARAFLYENGTMSEIGALPGGHTEIAYDINNFGQVVGYAWIAALRDYRAFLYSGGVVYDLNSLIPPDSGVVLRVANAINDAGQIVCTSDSGSFLLSPLAQPAAPSGLRLLTEDKSAHALALDSVNMLRAPFPLTTTHNFSPDRRTRVMLFVGGSDFAPGEDVTAFAAQAEDARGRIYPLTVEAVERLPGVDGVLQVNVKLPADVQGVPGLWVSVAARGQVSNKALLSIRL